MTCISLNFAQETEQKNNVFYCPEESQFYSYCLEMLLMIHFSPDIVVEFGSGDGAPVIAAILRTRFAGIVQGYEINPKACYTATRHISQYGLDSHYMILNDCFFKNSLMFEKRFLISNPPYLPCFSKEDMILPELCGGSDGAEIIKKLLSTNFTSVMMLVPSISNPLGVFLYAKNSGYSVSDFLVTALPFGYYSSRSEIQHHLYTLKHKNISFFSEKGYLIAGVLFQKKEYAETDRSEEISSIMQSVK